MKVLNIEYSIALDRINDIRNESIDVFVELGDGFTYVIEVATIKNITEMMEDGYLQPMCPQIIVDELREEIIWRAMKSYAQEDAFWLKMNAMAHTFTNEDLQVKIDETKNFHMELDEIEKKRLEEQTSLIEEVLKKIRLLESGEQFILNDVITNLDWHQINKNQWTLINRKLVQGSKNGLYKDLEVVKTSDDGTVVFRKK
ncbi:hypothetical protein [Enterococcus sp. LJL51]|uniref:hypothetical protein n=1 Tax=Enterococcus sp. LJL51 TaxID=3416656 RepID=UPI003CEA185C